MSSQPRCSNLNRPVLWSRYRISSVLVGRLIGHLPALNWRIILHEAASAHISTPLRKSTVMWSWCSSLVWKHDGISGISSAPALSSCLLRLLQTHTRIIPSEEFPQFLENKHNLFLLMDICIAEVLTQIPSYSYLLRHQSHLNELSINSCSFPCEPTSEI